MHCTESTSENVSTNIAVTASCNIVPEQLQLAVKTACYINGGDGDARAKAVQEAGHGLLVLADTSSPETVQSLASHLPVLEALFSSPCKGDSYRH